ncbi:hypothetical protein M885DRAFT_514887, partial [Pelagophyceae sp. CCMP2097]
MHALAEPSRFERKLMPRRFARTPAGTVERKAGCIVSWSLYASVCLRMAGSQVAWTVASMASPRLAGAPTPDTPKAALRRSSASGEMPVSPTSRVDSAPNTGGSPERSSRVSIVR